MIRRRDFIALTGAAASWPLAAQAQQPERIRRVGWLVGLAEQNPEVQSRIKVVVSALRDLGWILGRNLAIDYRFTAGEDQHFDAQAAELIALSPDLLLANNTPCTRALQQVTSTIPIVFALVLDPVASGIVKNIARPGGNITGFTNFEGSMGRKWLQLLKEAAPHITNVALIFNPSTLPSVGMLQSIEAAAPSFSINITTRGVADATELENAIAKAGHEPGTALIVFPEVFTTTHQAQIVALAMQYKLPAIYAYRNFVADGGLMSYGLDSPDLFRRVASYIDRIFKGEKPGDLPVQAPNKFDLFINLKAANAMGLTLPATLLGRADEVIE